MLLSVCLMVVSTVVDFDSNAGSIRPALHSSGFGPTICSQTDQDLADLKTMRFAYARTHDWALVNPGQRTCDYHFIFPLMRLDGRDPENYFFGPTDYILDRTRKDLESQIFFRLGTSIEHSGSTRHFNALVPEDFEKVAEIFAGTVRHYNRGWAKGFEWKIRYWEIWNEPDGFMNMWCPKEGTEDLDGEALTKKRAELRALYVRFFVTVLKRLKAEFGDEIKVGGPAICSWENKQWVQDVLLECRKARVSPDFVSWHCYANDPKQLNAEAEDARKVCDECGFPSCELILNEWHYFGENYTWQDMQRSSDPAVYARVWNGPDGHNGIRSACFTLAALANLQLSELDQAYFYGCSHVGAWGFKDHSQNKFKVFYALKLFGKIVSDYTTICSCATTGTLTTMAVKRTDGRKGLLVVDYGGSSRKISIGIKGVSRSAKARAMLLDNTHDLVTMEVLYEGGVLDVVKPDFFSAAYFVEFE